MKDTLNLRGQIAIFMVLIFNVLFIFFAMIINLGLLVHDKINLQNSVDLATYYAASKQAEVLSAIGHINYQIRQDWKLLSWRIRVLGDMGRSGHPLLNSNQPLTDTEILNAKTRSPSVCISLSTWTQATSGNKTQNLCGPENIRVPLIPEVPIIFPGPGNATLVEFNKRQREIYAANCLESGSLSWATAAQWYISFRFDVAQRKKTVRELAKNLSISPVDFVDLDGDSVLEGVKNTLRKNLTRGNLELLNDSDIRLYNSLGQGADSWSQWLNEIYIFPKIVYSDIYLSDGCKGVQKTLNTPTDENLPSSFKSDPAFRAKLDPDKILFDNRFEPGAPKLSDPSSLYHSTIGYEKNPWMMAYVGVKVKTKVRKPFSPFGDAVQTVARAFAKPFGGKIGPWTYTAWPRGASRSAGAKMTDELIPLVPQDENEPPTAKNYLVPNYSRFPGDALGLNSVQAVGALRDAFKKYGSAQTLSRYFWGFLPQNVDEVGGDPLAWSLMRLISEDRYLPNQLKNQIPWIRSLEIAAIAPDLFDTTYYSVDPSFYKSFISRASPLALLKRLSARGDLGSRGTPEASGGQSFGPSYSIGDQIKLAEGTFSADNTPGYLIRDPSHLLTSWVPNDAYDYTVTDQKPDQFAVCKSWGKIPSGPSCAVGGRSGFSVKLISKSYLLSTEHPLGGKDQKGPILNPPPQDF